MEKCKRVRALEYLLCSQGKPLESFEKRGRNKPAAPTAPTDSGSPSQKSLLVKGPLPCPAIHTPCSLLCCAFTRYCSLLGVQRRAIPASD